MPAPVGLALVEVAAPAAPCRNLGLRVILPGGGEIHVAGLAAMPLAAALMRELSRPC